MQGFYTVFGVGHPTRYGVMDSGGVVLQPRLSIDAAYNAAKALNKGELRILNYSKPRIEWGFEWGN